jgi:TPR repeat protein
MEDIEKELKILLETYQYQYDEPKNRDMIPKILDLYKNKVIDETCEDDDYLTYLGFYYDSVDTNNELIIKYYTKAVEKGNPHAMFNLASFYEVKGIYDEMLKYYLMGIENNDTESMYGLGQYYYLKKQFEDMKKYLEMAIEKGSTNAMIQYGNYYIDLKNIEEAKKYFDMAAEKKDYNGYHYMASFYYNKEYKDAKKYYILYLENETNRIKCYQAIEELIVLVMQNNDDTDFLLEYCKKYEIDTSSLDEYHIRRALQKQFMINKHKFTKEDTCSICYQDKTLIIFDCFGHYTCENCYLLLDKCPYCNIEKHQIMEKINILDTYDSEYSDDEESINTDDDIVINEGDGEKIDE